MRKLIIVGSIIALIVIAVVLNKVFSGMKTVKEVVEVKQKARFVMAERVTYSDREGQIQGSGRIESMQIISVSAEVQGKILQSEVELKKGVSFNKGDQLYNIYSQEAQLALKARKSRFLNAIAGILPDIKIDYKDRYEVWQGFFNNIDVARSLPELPDPTTEQEKIFLASRNISSEYFAIKGDEVRLSKYSIRAPFNGTFTKVNAEVGATASPGIMLAQIIRTDILELEVPLNISDSKWVKVGDKTMVSDNLNNEWEGVVVRKANFVDDKTQSVSVFIKIRSNTTQPLYKGSYLKAIFNTNLIKSAMEVPRNAIFNSNDVYLIKDGRLVIAPINILKINDKTIIFNGLDSGVYIVNQPLINASENEEVNLLNN